MVFAVYDNDALLKALADKASSEDTFQRIGGDLMFQPLTMEEWDTQMTSLTNSSNVVASSNADSITSKTAVTTTPYYDDEIPPFDVTVSFANELGQEAKIVIYGVEILNESNGFSMDTILSRKICTFVARGVEAMTPVAS